MNAKDIVILVCEKKSPAPYWTHAHGIYADLSHWPKTIDYYVKCPECGAVHGTYKSWSEARIKRLCDTCQFDKVEKAKKELAKLSEAEIPIPPDQPNEPTPDQPIDPDAPYDVKSEVTRYMQGDWVTLAKWQLEQALGERVDFEDDSYVNRAVDFSEPESFDKFTVVGESSGITYIVWKSEDLAEAEALEQVRNGLRDEPEIYTQSWLEGHIDTNKLRDFLYSDQINWTQEDFDENYSDYDSKVEFLVKEGKLPEETFYKKNGDLRRPTPALERLLDQAVEEWVKELTDDRLSDPMDYLREIYPEEEVMKHAMEWGGIDIEAAAKDAVNTDGWQHFLSHYDGKSIDLPGGAVAIRE